MGVNTAVWVVLVLLGAIGRLDAQAGSPSAEQEVAAARREQQEAQAQCRTDVMAKMRTPDYVIIFPAAVEGTGADIDKNCRPRKSPTEEDVRTRVYGGDTAIVTGVQTWYGPDGNRANRRRFTSVWVKHEGVWKHASFHATVIPEKSGGQ